MHVHGCSKDHGGAFTCDCPVGHIKKLPCRTETVCGGSLRAVNAKLLSALEEWANHVEQWHQAEAMGGGRRCTNCVLLERAAREAIEEARK